MSVAPKLIYEYQVGGSLPINAPSYVRRQADCDLYNGLKAGEFCYVLNSRQMGKSSLRVRTMQRLQAEGVACAAIDITAIGTLDITSEQWYAGVIDSIVSSLNLYEAFDLDKWWAEHSLLSHVQRLSKFIEEVLLQSISQNIVIFVDEIDSLLSLNFNSDDFFAVIRDCYNRRADHQDYRRLAFALIGVASPSDIIADKRRTPFNIGYAIEMTGFQLQEAQPLAVGLALKASNPQVVVQQILDWTGGQPFLSQKVCKLILNAESEIPTGGEAEWVEELVRSHIIDSWESTDEPEHLKTIRDRLLSNQQHAARRLGLYQQILQQGDVPADNSYEQMELRLSGLVVEQQGKLKVYNRIYESVFDQSWVDKTLGDLRPYAESITAWLASNCQDESRLLRGQAFQDAQSWAEGKSLTNEDYQFLRASQELDKRDVQIALEAERQAKQLLAEAQRKAELALEEERKANRILAQAQHKARQTIRKGLAGLTAISVVAIAVMMAASTSLQKAQEAMKLEQAGVTALRQFDSEEIEALLSAMKAGHDLQAMLKDRDHLPLEKYPAISPLWVLQTILDKIHERNQFIGHQGRVYSVSFSPDGQHLASVGQDGTVRLWNLSGKQLTELKGHKGPIWNVSFSPDGQRLATAGDDRTARLWDLSGKELVQFKGHQEKLTSVSFSPNGQHIATASEDGTARLWNLSGQQMAQLKGHKRQVWSVGFSPDGQRLATAGEDGTIRLWSLSGKQLAQFKGDKAPVLTLSFSPDGKQIASTGLDSTVRLWNLSGQIQAQWKSSRDWLYSVSFSPDGQSLATAGADGKVRLWDLSGQQLAELNGHRNWVYSASFSPDGQSLATAGADSTVRLWDLSKQMGLSRQQQAQWRGHSGEAWSVSFSPDGQRLATAGEDGKARLWNLSGQQLTEFNAHHGGVNSVTFSPDGQRLATAGHDSTVRLWNLSGQQLVELKGHQDRVYSVSFSPDEQHLATAGKDGTILLWTLQRQQKIVLKGHQGSVNSVTFSRNGQHLATAGKDGTVRLWNLSGKQLVQFKAHQGKEILSVSFSPDGQRLVTTGIDTVVRLWDLSGKQLAQVNTHQGGVVSASFSPDGQRLATAGQDGTIQLLLLSGRQLSGLQIAQLGEHQGRVYSVSFRPDGQYLATVGRDGMVRLWRIEGLDELLSRGCDWLNNYLTANPDASTLCSKSQ